jgi:hypothetical protein
VLRKELISFDLAQSDQKIGEKIAQFLKKVAQIVAKLKTKTKCLHHSSIWKSKTLTLNPF